MNSIVVQDLSHSYGKVEALRRIRFTIPPGAFVALLGPNGSGKSTLFQILSTLLEPSQGSVEVQGIDPRVSPSEVRAQLGVVFQSPSVDTVLTLRENLVYHGKILGLSSQELHPRIEEALEFATLKDLADRPAGKLSGGQARRLELSKLALTRPKVILLDEPTTGLDPQARQDFWSWLLKFQKHLDATTLFTTHWMEEAELADRVLMLESGQLVADGTPQALRSSLEDWILTLETDSPQEIQAYLEAKGGKPSSPRKGTLRLHTSPEAPWIQELPREFPEHLVSLHLGRPTLEDVYFERTGKTFQSPTGA